MADAFAAAFEAPRATRPRANGGAVGGIVRPPGPIARRAVAALEPLLAHGAAAERPLRPWLWPFVPLWMFPVTTLPRPEARAPVPVITVGALAAGGTGKTPVAAYFAQALAERTPVIVARGYGRASGAEVRLGGWPAPGGDAAAPSARQPRGTDVSGQPSAAHAARLLGDELAMLAKRGFRVVSSPDRLAGVLAAHKAGAGVAILDDALQSRHVRADLTTIVLDARWPRGGGPIPVGAARLPVSWLARADVVWVNHGPLPDSLRAHVRADAVVVEARYRPVAWTFRGERLPLEALAGRRAVAFAGIARPDGFFRAARRLGVNIDRTWIFPDHYAYSWADLQSIEAWLDDHVVVTTEKDAARLPVDAAVHALAVEVEILRGAEALAERLSAL
jgi:tetraacyldisaccharide 4'-kinase